MGGLGYLFSYVLLLHHIVNGDYYDFMMMVMMMMNKLMRMIAIGRAGISLQLCTSASSLFQR